MKRNRNSEPFYMDRKTLNLLKNQPNTSIEVQKHDYHLALHPFHLTNLSNSVKDILTSKLAKYNKKLKGILMGFQNIKITSAVAPINFDACYIHVDIVGEFFLFNPQVGEILNGVINKKSDQHVGCLVHKTFNVSIPKPENDSYWMGQKAQEGHDVVVEVTFVQLENRLPYIKGVLKSILTEDSGISTSEEGSLPIKNTKIIFGDHVDESFEEKKTKKNKKSRKENIEEDIENLSSKKKKHKKHTVLVDDLNENTENTNNRKKKKKHKHKIESKDTPTVENVDLNNKKHKEENEVTLNDMNLNLILNNINFYNADDVEINTKTDVGKDLSENKNESLRKHKKVKKEKKDQIDDTPLALNDECSNLQLRIDHDSLNAGKKKHKKHKEEKQKEKNLMNTESVKKLKNQTDDSPLVLNDECSNLQLIIDHDSLNAGKKKHKKHKKEKQKEENLMNTESVKKLKNQTDDSPLVLNDECSNLQLIIDHDSLNAGKKKHKKHKKEKQEENLMNSESVKKRQNQTDDSLLVLNDECSNLQLRIDHDSLNAGKKKHKKHKKEIQNENLMNTESVKKRQNQTDDSLLVLNDECSNIQLIIDHDSLNAGKKKHKKHKKEKQKEENLMNTESVKKLKNQTDDSPLVLNDECSNLQLIIDHDSLNAGKKKHKKHKKEKQEENLMNSESVKKRQNQTDDSLLVLNDECSNLQLRIDHDSLNAGKKKHKKHKKEIQNENLMNTESVKKRQNQTDDSLLVLNDECSNIQLIIDHDSLNAGKKKHKKHKKEKQNEENLTNTETVKKRKNQTDDPPLALKENVVILNDMNSSLILNNINFYNADDVEINTKIDVGINLSENLNESFTKHKKIKKEKIDQVDGTPLTLNDECSNLQNLQLRIDQDSLNAGKKKHKKHKKEKQNEESLNNTESVKKRKRSSTDCLSSDSKNKLFPGDEKVIVKEEKYDGVDISKNLVNENAPKRKKIKKEKNYPSDEVSLTDLNLSKILNNPDFLGSKNDPPNKHITPHRLIDKINNDLDVIDSLNDTIKKPKKHKQDESLIDGKRKRSSSTNLSPDSLSFEKVNIKEEIIDDMNLSENFNNQTPPKRKKIKKEKKDPSDEVSLSDLSKILNDDNFLDNKNVSTNLKSLDDTKRKHKKHRNDKQHEESLVNDDSVKRHRRSMSVHFTSRSSNIEKKPRIRRHSISEDTGSKQKVHLIESIVFKEKNS